MLHAFAEEKLTGVRNWLPPGMKHRFPSNPLWITAISSASPRKYSVSPGLTERPAPGADATAGDPINQKHAAVILPRNGLRQIRRNKSLPSSGYCLSRERFSTDELPQSDKAGTQRSEALAPAWLLSAPRKTSILGSICHAGWAHFFTSSSKLRKGEFCFGATSPSEGRVRVSAEPLFDLYRSNVNKIRRSPDESARIVLALLFSVLRGSGSSFPHEHRRSGLCCDRVVSLLRTLVVCLAWRQLRPTSD